MLAYPDPDLPYVVETDASNMAIGAVLSQIQDGEEKVFMYGSKAFSGKFNDDGVQQEEMHYLE